MFGRPGKLNENIINCMTFRQNDQYAIIIFISMVYMYVECGSGFTNVFIGAIPETKNLTLKINFLSILRLQVQYMI